MPDPATSPIPRDELLGLLNNASKVEEERITTPMPVMRLDELLAPAPIDPDAEECLDDCLDEILAPTESAQGTPPALLVHMPLELVDPSTIDLTGSRHVTITIVSFAVTLALGLLLLILF